MSQRTVVLQLGTDLQLPRDLVAGGVFVPGEALTLGEDCLLVLRNADKSLELHAQCVFVDAAKGSGLQLVGCDADMKQQIIALAAGMSLSSEPVPEPIDDHTADEEAPATEELAPSEAADEHASEEERKLALNVHERLRGLTLVQQIKIAQKGEVSERVVLERMYGKSVWEPLLRNPRITGPEVGRIARMGALPRNLVELIVSNGAWLQIPEVRRALLSNPRLGVDQIVRVLRLLPKHELKLAGMQTAYPYAVRDAAKRLLKESGGG
jgi:hypothetical protein